MNLAEKVQIILKRIEELEDDIKVLQSNINKAKDYLNQDLENINPEYFDRELDIEQGLKYIELN